MRWRYQVEKYFSVENTLIICYNTVRYFKRVCVLGNIINHDQ